MRNVKLDNKNGVGATSLAGRQLLPQRKSEGRFLADQAADAKTAMIQTLHDMKETLGKVADVRVCARQHPWLVVGSAVTAGFVAAAVVTPSLGKKTKKTQASSDAESEPGCREEEASRTKRSVLFSAAGTLLTGILRSVVQASIAAAVVDKGDKHPPAAETPAPHDPMGAGASEDGTAVEI